MIELAPFHKMGLPVPNPVLLAGGTIGYGEAVPGGLDLRALGGVVVGPVMRHSATGSQPPRLAALEGGMVLAAGHQNRGVGAVLKRFGSLWPGLGCPVVVQIADSQPDFVQAVARRIHGAPAVGGIELLLPAHADEALTGRLVRTAVRAGDLPIWAKLPLDGAPILGPAAVDAGAAGLVLGRAPTGAGLRLDLPGAPAVRGPLYGPLTFGPMLEALLQVAALDLPCALIACGGIHTVDQVRQALAAGARAVQIDSAVWVEPGLPGHLVGAVV